MPKESIDEYISTKEASQRFKLTQAHLGMLARNQTIKARKIGHDWLIYLPSLQAYLDTNPRPGIKPGTKLWWRKKPSPRPKRA